MQAYRRSGSGPSASPVAGRNTFSYDTIERLEVLTEVALSHRLSALCFAIENARCETRSRLGGISSSFNLIPIVE